MTKTLNLLGLGLAAAALIGCGSPDDLPTAPRYSAPADLAGLQEYAALGNSLTAGYQSGAWGNLEHVEASYPNLIARQLGIAGFKQVSMAGTGLSQVDVNADGINEGNMVVDLGPAGPSLRYSAGNASNMAAVAAGAPAGFDFSAPRNFGIPGITLAYAVGAPLGVYGDLATGNPYARFYLNSTSETKTQAQLAAESGATFITCWLGNNDVLGFVTSGGVDPITPTGAFQGSVNGLAALLGSVPYLVFMNIPNVTDIPYVTYVNPLVIAKLDALGAPAHAVYAHDDELDAVVPVFLDPGANNYLLLPAASAMSADPTLGASPANPLPDSLVLDAGETALSQAAVANFNGMLEEMVVGLNAQDRQHPALLVDMNAFFSTVVENGFSYAGETYRTDFVTGGMFSLDGVHPSSLGYAIVANHILAQMSEDWNLELEPVDLAEFIGNRGGLGSVAGPLALPDFRSVVELFQH